MKVLQINSVCGIGSTGRIATDIHNILIKQGHESYIAYGRDLPKNCENAIRIGTKIDNYTHVAKTRLFDKHGFGSKRATEEFIKEIKKIDPDIIHLHNIHGYYINIEVLFNYLKEANKPVVWTLHDCWAFTGHCAHFDYIGCDKWKSGCSSCPAKREYPSSLLLDSSKINYISKKDIFSGVDNLTIVTPSQWLANLVKESFLQDYPIKVINNGIDLSVFKPTVGNFRDQHNLSDKYIILGVANIWEKRKGLDYFHKMEKSLRDDEVIVLVGLSKKQLEELPEKMVGISRTNNVDELVDIYSSADIFVNPTLEEVMGLTNVEALACGTPVITFDSGGSPECVDDTTGFVVGKGQIDKAIEIIRGLRDTNKRFDSSVCRNRAKHKYDKNTQNNMYVNIYRENI